MKNITRMDPAGFGFGFIEGSKGTKAIGLEVEPINGEPFVIPVTAEAAHEIGMQLLSRAMILNGGVV